MSTTDAKIPEPEMPVMGRPVVLKLDEPTLTLVMGLGRIQCTQRECAAALGVGLGSFERFMERHPIVREILKRGYDTGLMSLRRAQFAKALDGNPTMMIWLGKQYLGQSDKLEHRMGETSDKPLKYVLSDAELIRIAVAGSDSAASSAGDVAPEPSTKVTH